MLASVKVDGAELSAVGARYPRGPLVDAEERQQTGQAGKQEERQPTEEGGLCEIVATAKPPSNRHTDESCGGNAD